jgi:hypothetical protein
MRSCRAVFVCSVGVYSAVILVRTYVEAGGLGSMFHWPVSQSWQAVQLFLGRLLPLRAVIRPNVFASFRRLVDGCCARVCCTRTSIW